MENKQSIYIKLHVCVSVCPLTFFENQSNGHNKAIFQSLSSAILWDRLSQTIGYTQPNYRTYSAILWDILSHTLGHTLPYYMT